MAKNRRKTARSKRAAQKRRSQANASSRRHEPQFFEAMGAVAPVSAPLPGTIIYPESPATASLEPARPGLAHVPALPWGDINTNTARAALHDMALAGGWLLRKLVGKGARRLYVAVAATAVVAGGAFAAQTGIETINKYRAILANPGAIVVNKHVGTTITDRNGVVLYRAHGATDNPRLKLSEIPQVVKDATISTEDPYFYQHDGVSWRDTARAVYVDVVEGGKVQGGSTITQQLVKYNLLTSEKSFTRKFNEMALSMEVEKRYNKDQILEMYLNSIYYGQGAYGIESASQTYFRKPAKELTLAEASLLAGLPQSPSRYDPNINPEAAFARRDYVLSRMAEEGKITQQVADETKKVREPTFTRNVVLRAPHFVFYVLNELTKQYGEERVEQGGLIVKTSLDITKQEVAENAVRTQVAALRGNSVSNAGLVTLDPKNGDILAMVGSIDYYEPTYGSVNVTLSQLQPGSSIKPVAYAAAFAKGWNGATTIQDKPLNIRLGDGSVYKPQNYDEKFRGPVTMRRSLSNSLNIPAVEALQFATLDTVKQTARDFGLTTISDDASRYGPSFVLGGVEARPLDMAAAYSVFARGGTTVAPQAIVNVVDKQGTDITQQRPNKSQQVIDPRVAYQITSILSDNQTRQELFGANSPLQLSRTAAVKTGTTNDFRDNWTIGYTPDIVTAIWVGNNDHSPMNGVTGVSGAAPIWKSYMEAILAGVPDQQFAVPGGLIQQRVCRQDGGLVDANDPNGVGEWFLAEKPQTKRCGENGGGLDPNRDRQKRRENESPQPEQPPAAAAPAQPPVGGSGGGNAGGGNSGSGGNDDDEPADPTPSPTQQPGRQPRPF